MLKVKNNLNQGDNERNYHIFYQLLKGATDKDLEYLGMKKSDMQKFNYINKSGCYDVNEMDDSLNY